MSSKIPFLKFTAHAGFPSPAEDFLEPGLNLNEYLIQNSAATFCVKVKGDSMVGSRITTGDILIVDRSLSPQNQNVILAILNGNFIVKKLLISNNDFYLLSDNKYANQIKINSEMEFYVWGVVTYVIHKLSR
ncbi:MAG: translesion error-prone DNA polymerase V autoproteolytic subunit [SAR202 cluster bacterium]|jgi:DNA polymerase V|nr:translesion error-prone DNA polymerase V autoproteolytic subunit [SAR202 cluster bacterium]|tara:strand:+ start:705 stop:1100 length:396 start_codon:yes stop_codon:yes gene_type:complete